MLREAAASLASALRHCHASGVAHRDVKPDNVLVFHTSDAALCPAFKLCDFGAASVFSKKQASGKSHRVTSTRPIGSGFYCAPEIVSIALENKAKGTRGPSERATSEPVCAEVSTQAHAESRDVRQDTFSTAPQLALRPNKTKSARYAVLPVDVWSFGITLFVLGTGHLPFKKASSCEPRYVAFLRATGQLHGPNATCVEPEAADMQWMWPAYLSQSFVDLITLCLRTDPRQRPKFEDLLLHPFCRRQGDTKVPEATVQSYGAHDCTSSKDCSWVGQQAPISSTPIRTSHTYESHPSLPQTGTNDSWSTAPGCTQARAPSAIAAGARIVAGRRGSLGLQQGTAFAAAAAVGSAASPPHGVRLAFGEQTQASSAHPLRMSASTNRWTGTSGGGARDLSGVTRERSQSFRHGSIAKAGGMTRSMIAACTRPRSRSEVTCQNLQHYGTHTGDDDGASLQRSGGSSGVALSPADEEDAVGFVVRQSQQEEEAYQRAPVRAFGHGASFDPQEGDFDSPPSPLQPAMLGRLRRRGSGVLWAAGATTNPEDSEPSSNMQPLVLPSLDGDSSVAGSAWSSAFSSHAAGSMSTHDADGSFVRQASSGTVATSSSASRSGRMSSYGASVLQELPTDARGHGEAIPFRRQQQEPPYDSFQHSSSGTPGGWHTSSYKSGGHSADSPRKLALSGLGTLTVFTAVGPPRTARGEGHELPVTPRLDTEITITDGDLEPARGPAQSPTVGGVRLMVGGEEDKSTARWHTLQPMERLTTETTVRHAIPSDDDTEEATVSIETHAASFRHR